MSKLEKELGFSNGSLSKGMPKADRVHKIADYFGLPMDYFFNPSSVTTLYSPSDHEEELLSGEYHYDIRKVLDIALRISDDSELYAMVERASKDTNFRKRLLGIVKLMEKTDD